MSGCCWLVAVVDDEARDSMPGASNDDDNSLVQASSLLQPRLVIQVRLNSPHPQMEANGPRPSRDLES